MVGEKKVHFDHPKLSTPPMKEGRRKGGLTEEEEKEGREIKVSSTNVM